LSYDQEPPPADGGRPATEAVVGGDGPVLVDIEEIGIADVRGDPDEAPPPHVHRRHVESFYVLEGELAFVAGDRELRAGAGSWLQLPPGVPHTFSISEPARFLDLHTPSCGLGTLDQQPAA
jgi:quercetin dioxygenase-like cupin family protein